MFFDKIISIMKTSSLPNIILKVSVALGFVLLLTNDILYLIYALNGRASTSFRVVSGILLNVVSIVFYAIIFFNQRALKYYSIVCFAHSAHMLFFEPENLLGVFTFILGIVILIDAKFFKKRAAPKILSITTLYFSLVLTELRFGINEFISYAMHKIGLGIMGIVIFTLLFRYIEQNYIPKKYNTLDLTKFPDLTQRDKEWIIKVLENTKYDTIAREYNLNLGTVKNHFRKLYKILEVDDRQGFLTEYAGATVLCTSEDVQKYNETQTH